MRTRFGPRFLETARGRVRRSLELLGKPTETEKLITELHSLAGEAAMLGLELLSDTARKGEEQAKEWKRGSTTAALYCARSVRALSQQVEEFAASIAAPPSDSDAAPAERSTSSPAAAPSPGPSEPSSEPLGDAASPAGDDRRRVLIIDDSRLAGDHLCDALGSAGMDTRLATGRDSALAELGEFVPELVLCDVHMPGVDLDELCGALRSQAPGSLFIMLISGMSEPELARRAQEVEANDYVSKHAGIERVVAKVQAALQELAR